MLAAAIIIGVGVLAVLAVIVIFVWLNIRASGPGDNA